MVIDAAGNAGLVRPRTHPARHRRARSHGHAARRAPRRRPAALARILAAAGARDDAHIVLYGDDAMSVGWMYRPVASLGHADHVSVLDGNLAAWRAANHPVATGRCNRDARQADAKGATGPDHC